MTECKEEIFKKGKKGTSVLNNSLLWFGAGVSLAEILTGTYFSSLGMMRGLLAIVIGHIIGCSMLFAAGLIGGQMRRSSMETVKMSFGQKGSLLFCVLNILQLVGWTSIMIYDGAAAADTIFHTGAWIWCLVIGGLIIVWILIGISNLGRINVVAMTALFILTLLLCKLIFFSGNPAQLLTDDSLSFGAAVELAVAMPLSWLPLISDYTREAEKPAAATLASTVVYGLISCWMYIIGMGAAIYTGDSDIASIMVKAGLGVAGLLIVIFSTVTTTFLDAFSAGVSSVSVSGKMKEKWAAVAATGIGMIGAIFFPMDDITDFLYLIGSVFAPMIAIQIADYFILHQDSSGRTANVRNLVIWAVGFTGYRLLMQVDTPLGNTLPDMLLTVGICLLVHVCARGMQTEDRKQVRAEKSRR